MAKPPTRAASRLPYVLRIMHARPRLLVSIALGIAVTLTLSLFDWRPSSRIVLG